MKSQATGYNGGVFKVGTPGNAGNYFFVELLQNWTLTPQVQGQGSQKQQGSTSSNT